MACERVYLALLHHPVYDREGRVVSTALTTIDVHDLGRVARTYGMGGVFIVTPLKSQHELGRRMVRHWVEGPGAAFNPTRKEALKLIHFAYSLDEALDAMETWTGSRPKTIATSAKKWPQTITFEEMARIIHEGGPYLLLLGTGWGIAKEVIMAADYRLEPIEGKGYNHLSVRAAAAIIVDRLLGRCQR
ncbi:MAG: RNA methyltransferase [Deltaproteobacteria bacterium]|nr:MAG: RNA methyltransferase [Deltaproteobacteria bacterium]